MTCLRSHSKQAVDESRQFGHFNHAPVGSPLLCRQGEGGDQVYFAPPHIPSPYSGTCHSQLPTKGREGQRGWGASCQKDVLGQPGAQEQPPEATFSPLPGSRIRKNQCSKPARMLSQNRVEGACGTRMWSQSWADPGFLFQVHSSPGACHIPVGDMPKVQREGLL